MTEALRLIQDLSISPNVLNETGLIVTKGRAGHWEVSHSGAKQAEAMNLPIRFDDVAIPAYLVVKDIDHRLLTRPHTMQQPDVGRSACVYYKDQDLIELQRKRDEPCKPMVDWLGPLPGEPKADRKSAKVKHNDVRISVYGGSDSTKTALRIVLGQGFVIAFDTVPNSSVQMGWTRDGYLAIRLTKVGAAGFKYKVRRERDATVLRASLARLRVSSSKKLKPVDRQWEHHEDDGGDVYAIVKFKKEELG